MLMLACVHSLVAYSRCRESQPEPSVLASLVIPWSVCNSIQKNNDKGRSMGGGVAYIYIYICICICICMHACMYVGVKYV